MWITNYRDTCHINLWFAIELISAIHFLKVMCLIADIIGNFMYRRFSSYIKRVNKNVLREVRHFILLLCDTVCVVRKSVCLNINSIIRKQKRLFLSSNSRHYINKDNPWKIYYLSIFWTKTHMKGKIDTCRPNVAQKSNGSQNLAPGMSQFSCAAYFVLHNSIH